LPLRRAAEPSSTALQFALREGPERHDLEASGQRVSQAWDGQDPRRTGEKEPAGSRVTVDFGFDGQEQFRRPRYLFEEEKPVVSHEFGRVGVSRS
jgi:hypothetical protein